jgi:hypothetical protein
MARRCTAPGNLHETPQGQSHELMQAGRVGEGPPPPRSPKDWRTRQPAHKVACQQEGIARLQHRSPGPRLCAAGGRPTFQDGQEAADVLARLVVLLSEGDGGVDAEVLHADNHRHGLSRHTRARLSRADSAPWPGAYRRERGRLALLPLEERMPARFDNMSGAILQAVPCAGTLSSVNTSLHVDLPTAFRQPCCGPPCLLHLRDLRKTPSFTAETMLFECALSSEAWWSPTRWRGGARAWLKKAEQESQSQLPLLMDQSPSMSRRSKTSRPFSQYTNCTRPRRSAPPQQAAPGGDSRDAEAGKTREAESLPLEEQNPQDRQQAGQIRDTVRQGACRERGTLERGAGSRVMARAGRGSLTRSPRVRKQATAWRARWCIQPCCRSCVMMASIQGKLHAHAQQGQGAQQPTGRGPPPATRNQKAQCRRDTGCAALPTCVRYHDAEAGVRRWRGRSAA